MAAKKQYAVERNVLIKDAKRKVKAIAKQEKKDLKKGIKPPDLPHEYDCVCAPNKCDKEDLVRPIPNTGNPRSLLQKFVHCGLYK